MGIFEDITENKVTELHLSVPADEVAEDIHMLFKALGENKSIESVHLTDDFIGDLRSDSRTELLAALGSVSSLKEAHLADGLLMIEGIAKMVLCATSLRALTLKNIILQGTEDDFKTCESALYQHPNLKEFELSDCDAAMKEISLDGLAKAGKKSATGNAGSIADPIHNTQIAKTA